VGLQLPTHEWWESEVYGGVDQILTDALRSPEVAGPKGPALVRAYENGSTQRGWGDDEFMERYLRTEFAPRRTEYGYESGKHVAALVMRSLRLVCVDIDGKNGGNEHAGELGPLPITLAETSKSGTGYHLYYLVEADSWSDTEGFGLVPDQIGIVTGVDIRGVGCVYHHPTQRWNDRPIAPLPDWLLKRLLLKKQQRLSSAATIHKILTTMDETEIMLMQTDLIQELEKPLKPGSRNNTLFAIGGQLKQAQVDDWQTKVRDRAIEVGLDDIEADKLVQNIENYG